MSRSRRARVETLRVRMEHLKERIETATLEGRVLSYDRAEFAALEWALPILEGHCEATRVLQAQLTREKQG